MTDLAALADQLPSWVLVVLAAVVAVKYLVQGLAESSEHWARILGPLGRRWRNRAQRRTDQEAADLSALRRQLSNLADEVTRLTNRDRERAQFEETLRAYLVYDAAWHFRAQLAAASSGSTLPEHLSFTQWEAQRPMGPN
ncbi:hypothetical protein [Nocardia farcinica]